jgi:peptidoglycan-N-acetylglucosamine deacetylase
VNSSDSYPWPNGAKSAVSLTFDDGVPSQYETVIPMLNQAGMQGTVYVTMADGGPFYAEEDLWRDAVSAGHEIGNHSMTHPCCRNLWVAGDGLNTDVMTFEAMEAQIVEAKRRLEDGIPDQPEHSFAYPCGEKQVGRGVNKQSYVPAVAKHYIAGRGVGDGVSINDPAQVDLADIWAPMPVDETGERLVSITQRALDQGKWAVLAFHGIGDKHLSNTVETFQYLLDWLGERREEVWVDSLIHVARWVHDHQTST